jgi:hypothetical protein
MDERKCARCGQVKPLHDFGKKKRRPNDYQSYCRPCQSEYHREHYRKNKDAYLASVRRRFGRLQVLLRAAKDKPCADCGVRYPYYVMDLDHREGVEKIGPLAHFLKKHSIRLLVAEIAKCDVVCSNCHRERTHQRKLRKAERTDRLVSVE